MVSHYANKNILKKTIIHTYNTFLLTDPEVQLKAQHQMCLLEFAISGKDNPEHVEKKKW